MPANTNPIFTHEGNIKCGVVLTALSGTYDGTGANDILAFEADPDDGSFLDKIRFKAKGANVQTLARIFINNGQDHTVAANNSFYDDVALPSTSASATVQQPFVELSLQLQLKAGFKIYIGLAVAVASGWQATPIGGNF